MTLKGVFFLLGQYIYGGNCYFVNGPILSQGFPGPELLEHQRQLRKGDAHTAHDVHDLAVFSLHLALFQFFQFGLLFRDFGLDLFDLGFDFRAFRSCHR